MDGFDFEYKNTKLYFGEGSVKKLAKDLKGIERATIATGSSAAKASGALADVTAVLAELDIDYNIYDKITANPTVEESQGLASAAWDNASEAIIAIGGGSTIDAAKFASIVKMNGGKVLDYFYGSLKIRDGIPVYAVNLTHGTGTEVDRYAVLTDPEKKEKRGFSVAYPKASVDDPKYMQTLPKEQKLYTSLDAFYHSYEATTRLDSSFYVEFIAKEAASNIATWLPVGVADYSKQEVPYWLLYASMMAGMAIDMAGTHIIHMLEHALSGINQSLPHGAGLAILGPRAAYYTHKLSPRKSASVLFALNHEIKPIAEDAEEAESSVTRFQESLGFEKTLSDYGFDRKDVNDIVDLATHSRPLQKEIMPMDESMLKDIVLSSI
ncbi:MAG: iron-containing alcohol dehydrogenase [Candidatus Micrarchaeia archaeon]